MKSRAFSIAVAAAALLLSFAPVAMADGPVVVGLNGNTRRVKLANVGWVRTGIAWRDMNTNANSYNFTDSDNLITEAYDNNVSVVFILSTAPQWCGGDANGGKPCDLESWKTFVTQFVAHVQTIPEGKWSALKAIEIWNEPDDFDSGTQGVGWDQDLNAAPRYVDYVVEAAKIIHAIPGGPIKVVAPSVSGKRITTRTRTATACTRCSASSRTRFIRTVRTRRTTST